MARRRSCWSRKRSCLHLSRVALEPKDEGAFKSLVDQLWRTWLLSPTICRVIFQPRPIDDFPPLYKREPFLLFFPADISPSVYVSSSRWPLNHSSFHHTDGVELKAGSSVRMAKEEKTPASTVYLAFDFARYMSRKASSLLFHAQALVCVAK